MCVPGVVAAVVGIYQSGRLADDHGAESTDWYTSVDGWNANHPNQNADLLGNRSSLLSGLSTLIRASSVISHVSPSWSTSEYVSN